MDGPAEARLLHPSSSGFFAVLRRNQQTGRLLQKMYSLDRLESVVQAMRSVPDAYLSQASFVQPLRRVSMLREIRSAFVDIDGYTMGWRVDAGFVDRVLSRAVELGIPRPSYVVSSGRGLYLKWLFTDAIGALMLPQWRALQSTLVAVFKAVGADIKVRDAARVLRVLGSTNAKVEGGAPVEVIYRGDQGVHDFAGLCARASAVYQSEQLKDVVIDVGGQDVGGRIAKARGSAQKLAGMLAAQSSTTDLTRFDQMAVTHEPIMMQSMTAQSLSWGRFLDLRSLALARGGVGRGSRDQFLFWGLNFLAHAGMVDAGNFWQEAKSFASIISRDEDFCPLQDGSMGSLYRRVKELGEKKWAKWGGKLRTPLYTASNALLIEQLGIEESEQRDLATLIGKGEKRRRSDLKVPGRAQRRVERQELREKIGAALSVQMPVAEVAQLCDVSESTVRRRGQAAGQSDQKRKRDRFVELLQKGGSLLQAANAVGISERTAYRWQAAYGGGDWRTKCAEMLAAGQGVDEIVLALNVSRASVYRFKSSLNKDRVSCGLQKEKPVNPAILMLLGSKETANIVVPDTDGAHTMVKGSDQEAASAVAQVNDLISRLRGRGAVDGER